MEQEKIEKQQCPLCNEHQAEFVTFDHNDKKRFKCPVCTKFEIQTPNGVKLIKQVLPDKRKYFSERAQTAPQGKILLITTVPLGDHRVFCEEYVPYPR